jgi:ribosomal-protein-alanine N-acetyltransferase
VADEIQITNLAVHIDYRRRGIARRLLLHALQLGYEAGARLGVLEVRESNEGARALYKTVGFVAVQKRSHYYSESREDALVMVLSLD